MAAPIECVALSGLTIYCTIHDTNGQLWNGSGFEVFSSGHWSSYVTPLTEQTSSGYYLASFPAGIGAGKYTLVQYQQQGGSPALGTDPAIGSGSIYWNGTAEEQGVAIVLNSTGINLQANQSGVTIGTVNSLGTTALTQVLTQIQTALGTDTIPELSGIPAATPTIKQALMIMYMGLRNQHTATALQEKIYNSAGTVVATAGVSDDGVTFVKSKFS